MSQVDIQNTATVPESMTEDHRNALHSLAEAFNVCTRVLERVFKHSMTNNHASALQFGILRLRLGRWGEACNIHERRARASDDVDIEDVKYAEKMLRELSDSLDIEGPQNDEKRELLDPVTKAILNTIEAIAVRRSPQSDTIPNQVSPQPTGNSNGGPGVLTETYFVQAGRLIDELETTIGSPSLWDLSSKEKAELVAAHNIDAVAIIAMAAKHLDCWTANHAPGVGGGNLLSLQRMSKLMVSGKRSDPMSINKKGLRIE